MSEFGSLWYSRTLNEVDAQIARQATICKVRILDPGVIRRILDNDETVCGSRNAAAFAGLRNLLMMHYQVRDKAVAALGEEQAKVLVERIVAALRERIGEQLGGETPRSS
jgi:hypothetical protein